MQKSAIKEIIANSLGEYLDMKGVDVTIDEHTCLIGSNAVLDSIGLVTVIVEIESLLDEQGIEVSLTSEKAMSSAISPFRSIGALVNFVHDQIEEQNAG